MGRLLPKRDRSEDEDLISRIGEGDEEALEVFYNTFFPRLYRYIYYRVGRDHHHTEEVVHDTFVEALNRAERYEPERGSVESWLITLSRNRIRSNNSAMSRPHDYEKSWSMVDGEMENLFADMSEGSLPETALVREEMRDLVGAAMSSISDNYAKLLEMKYLRGMSVRDMAGLLKKTEKSVESQLTRARIAFREAFKSIAVEMPF